MIKKSEKTNSEWSRPDEIKCYKCGHSENTYEAFIITKMTADRGLKTTTITELT